MDIDQFENTKYNIKDRIISKPSFIINISYNMKLTDKIITYNNGRYWKIIPHSITLIYPIIYDIYYDNIDDPNDNGADYSDRFLENGSYLRIKTIQLGYTIPNDLSKKVSIERCRFYVAGDNLFTSTKYTGYNPDVSADGLGGRGIDYKSYPLSKTIIFGMQLNF